MALFGGIRRPLLLGIATPGRLLRKDRDNPNDPLFTMSYSLMVPVEHIVKWMFTQHVYDAVVGDDGVNIRLDESKVNNLLCR